MADKARRSSSNRFQILPDGTHSHTLGHTNEPQKLSQTIRNLLSGWRRIDQPTVTEDHLRAALGSKDAVTRVRKDSDQLQNLGAADYGILQHVVGQGSTGTVTLWHLTDPSNKEIRQCYAIKKYRRRAHEPQSDYRKRVMSDFCIASCVRHANIMNVLHVFQDAKLAYCMVMEFCAGGDLRILVQTAGSLDAVEADCYFKQLMRGVEHMHDAGVAHRDLKPDNLLLTARGGLKITDFGCAECFQLDWETRVRKSFHLRGTIAYSAPEEYLHEGFDPRAVDVWATGLVYMFMRTGSPLWQSATSMDADYRKYFRARTKRAGYGPIEGLDGSQRRHVIYSTLDPNPSHRITATQVLKSVWVQRCSLCKAGEDGL